MPDIILHVTLLSFITLLAIIIDIFVVYRIIKQRHFNPFISSIHDLQSQSMVAKQHAPFYPGLAYQTMIVRLEDL